MLKVRLHERIFALTRLLLGLLAVLRFLWCVAGARSVAVVVASLTPIR